MLLLDCGMLVTVSVAGKGGSRGRKGGEIGSEEGGGMGRLSKKPVLWYAYQ